MSNPGGRAAGGRGVVLVLIVLLVGLLAAATSWQQAEDQATQQDAAELRRAADRLATVEDTIDASLAGASGLVRADGTLDVAAFRAFATDLAETSDLDVLGLEQVVPRADRAEVEDAIGRPFTDRGAAGVRESPSRPVHYPVVAVAPPSETSEELIGFDLLGNDVRRAAAETARDTGRTVLSAPVPSQPTGTPSFFVIRPIYRQGGPFETVAARRENLVGFVSTAYAGAGLGDELATTLPAGAQFAIRDGDEQLATTSPGPDHGSERSVDAGSRTWTLEVEDTTRADHGTAILLGVITLLLALGVAVEVRRTARRNRALVESTDRAEQLAALAELLLAAGTVEEVGQIATTLGRRAVGADATSVGLVAGPVLRVVHGETVPDEYRVDRQEPPLDAPLAFTTAARTGETYLFEDQATYERAFPAAGGPSVGARAVLPLRRADGEVIGAIAHLWHHERTFDDAHRSLLSTVADLTGQALERARLAALRIEVARQSEELARLTQGLATSRSSDDVLRFLTDGVTTPLGASHAVVAVIEGDRLVRHYTPGPHTARVRSVLPDVGALSAPSPLAEAARTGEAVLLPSLEDVRARYPQVVEAWQALGFAATANLPLVDRRGEVIGALGLAWDHTVDFDHLRDRLATIAGIAGQTLDRARLSDAEHHLVRSMQDGLLLPLPPQLRLAVAQRYVPAASEIGMGGDWYEGIAREDGRYTVVVGDVAGHGISAIADMAQLRAVIGAMAAFDFPIDQIFPLATSLPHRDGPIVASAALAEIDPAAGELRYSCAGHPPPVVRHADGVVHVLDQGRQPLLGLPMQARPVARLPFLPGSVLVAYTDGLIERRDRPIDDGIEQLAAALAAVRSSDPEDVADALLADLLAADGSEDDVAIAVVVHLG